MTHVILSHQERLQLLLGEGMLGLTFLATPLNAAALGLAGPLCPQQLLRLDSSKRRSSHSQRSFSLISPINSSCLVENSRDHTVPFPALQVVIPAGDSGAALAAVALQVALNHCLSHRLLPDLCALRL